MLHGFEQELTATGATGDLIIHDSLIEDCPIIIRLAH